MGFGQGQEEGNRDTVLGMNDIMLFKAGWGFVLCKKKDARSATTGRPTFTILSWVTAA